LNSDGVAAMSESLQQVTAGVARGLFTVAATRAIERHAAAGLAPYTLMRRAGSSAARLALALAPHARLVWVAAGAGNNGGDGLEAAAELRKLGKQVVVSWLGSRDGASADSKASLQRALDAGVRFADAPPADWDLALDALLGIGASRAPEGRMADWIACMNQNAAPVLAIDLPSGLQADTGFAAGRCVSADATLSLLTLKPGLFTGMGRDASGQVWLDGLGVDLVQACGATQAAIVASLAPAPPLRARLHAAHKGSQGDVAVVGGAPGMSGAAVLAATAALHRGAGRVYLCMLDPSAAPLCAGLPELMCRTLDQLDLARVAVACGCGGGDAVRAALPRLLSAARRLVLDADALNAIAVDAQLRSLVRMRRARGYSTIVTPHPLEAARLCQTSADAVQRNRLQTAQGLAEALQCTVLLKGSGTVVASPERASAIVPTGNGLLATAGTGDVLAGALAAALAAGVPEFDSALQTAYSHGKCADDWPTTMPLTAAALARSAWH